MAFIDFAYIVNRYGAQEVAQLFYDRITPHPESYDVLRAAAEDPSDPPFDATGMTTIKAIVDGFIDDAHSIVEGYLRSVFEEPLNEATAPRSVLIHEAAITRYFMFGTSAPDVVKFNYDQAIDWLKDVSARRVHVGLTTDGDSPGEDDMAVVVRQSEYEEDLDIGTSGRVFTASRLNRFIG